MTRGVKQGRQETVNPIPWGPSFVKGAGPGVIILPGLEGAMEASEWPRKLLYWQFRWLPMADSYPELVEELAQEGVIKTPRIKEAMLGVDRRSFLMPEAAEEAAVDAPIPIGFGQTISQPRTVALMLELLQPQSGERVLDVGAGSGWTTALFAWLVGPEGTVFALERIPQLRRRAEAAVAAAGFPGVTIATGDGSVGWKEHAPYDIIHVAAAAKRMPTALAEQLKPGGRLVVPVGEYVQEMVRVVRSADGSFVRTTHGSFTFVPLIED